MATKTRHSFSYWQWRVILCSMIGYSMFYFVRKNFSFAMPVLNEQYGISNTNFGIILSSTDSSRTASTRGGTWSSA